MRARLASTALAFGVLATIGCAGPMPPPDLVNARSVYQRAAKGPAQQQAPAALDDAKKALEAAERSASDDPEAAEASDLSKVAVLRSELAEATARQLIAQKEKEAAEKEYINLTGEQLRTTKKELSLTKEQLAAAEKKAAQALADLQRIAAVKQESRGMVITLSGSVLFASNESTLLPSAMVKLNEVADALIKGNPDSNILVEGHTDSQGQRSYNMELGRKRAEAVRDQLVSRGVAADRIKGVGIGPDRPIADNRTAEGRANNRRVEIIVEPGSH